MGKLGQLLVARGWITVQQLTRALQNQPAVGGRLGTCLVEMEALSEENLLRGLAEQLGVPAVAIDDLRGIPDEVLAVVPDKIARRCRVIPFRVVGSRLDVAMMDPRNLASQDEIAFASGKRVNVHVVHELRIVEALERYYREESPSRISLLVERLNRARYFWERQASENAAARPPAAGGDELPLLVAPPSAAPSATLNAITAARRPQPVSAAPLPRPAGPPPPAAALAPKPANPAAAATATPPRPAFQTVSLTAEERALLGSGARAQPAAAAPVPVPAPAMPPPAAILAPHPPAPNPVSPSLPSPTSVDEAEKAFASTSDREEVGRIALGFLGRSYRRTALFQVARDKVSGWMAQGEVDLPVFQRFAVGFDEASLFLNLRQGSGIYMGPMPAMPAHRELARAWGGELPRDCVLLPVRVRDRLVSVIYADGGSRSGSKGMGGVELAQLQRLAASMSAALERCILHRKRAEAKS